MNSQRPTLDKNISVHDFEEFYWLKAELVAFCKIVNIASNGSKIDITSRIKHFLLTGKPNSIIKVKNKTISTFNWDKASITKETLITDNYKNGENVRHFFKSEIGEHFKFNVDFMHWMKNNVGKNMAEAILAWNEIAERKNDKNYISKIDSQFEYNQYIRSFLQDNPTLSLKDAIKYWKLKRSQRGKTTYHETDLNLN